LHFKLNTICNFDYYYRKEQATPEDIDYFECQQEMVQELYQQHMLVERVIGNLSLSSPIIRSGFLKDSSSSTSNLDAEIKLILLNNPSHKNKQCFKSASYVQGVVYNLCFNFSSLESENGQ
jgi:hypothetical protein